MLVVLGGWWAEECFACSVHKGSFAKGEMGRTALGTQPYCGQGVKPILLEHRDFIYNEYLELPIDL